MKQNRDSQHTSYLEILELHAPINESEGKSRGTSDLTIPNARKIIKFLTLNAQSDTHGWKSQRSELCKSSPRESPDQRGKILLELAHWCQSKVLVVAPWNREADEMKSSKRRCKWKGKRGDGEALEALENLDFELEVERCLGTVECSLINLLRQSRDPLTGSKLTKENFNPRTN